MLLRPAASRWLTATPPAALVGGAEPLGEAPIEEIRALMPDAMGDGRDRLAAVLRHWLAPFAERVDGPGKLVNDACHLAEQQAGLLRTADLARQLGLSTRSLERLLKEHIGLTPKWLIDCRRLQHAATSLFTAPDTDLAALAGDLGYADQAHFTRHYRRVLGETPGQTRQAGQDRRRLAPA